MRSLMQDTYRTSILIERKDPSWQDLVDRLRHSNTKLMPLTQFSSENETRWWIPPWRSHVYKLQNSLRWSTHSFFWFEPPVLHQVDHESFDLLMSSMLERYRQIVVIVLTVHLEHSFGSHPHCWSLQLNYVLRLKFLIDRLKIWVKSHVGSF